MSHVEAASLAVEPRRGSWNQRWVTLELSNQPFAIPVEHCQDIVMLSPLSCRPNPLPFERGMMRLRERVLPALDLRKRLGMCSFVDELDELEAVLEAREQDHINWLNELDKSVEEGRPFTLTIPTPAPSAVGTTAFAPIVPCCGCVWRSSTNPTRRSTPRR